MEPSPLALELAALLLARARPLAELVGAAAAALPADAAAPAPEHASAPAPAPQLRRVSHDLAAPPPPAALVATEPAVSPAQAEAAALASLARGGGAGASSLLPSPLHPRASRLALSPLAAAAVSSSRAGGASSHRGESVNVCSHRGASVDVSAAASPSFDSGQSSPASPAATAAASFAAGSLAAGGVHAFPRSATHSRSSSRGAAPAFLIPASFADAWGGGGELSVITVGGARSAGASPPASQPPPIGATLRASPLSAFSRAAAPLTQLQPLAETQLASQLRISTGEAEGDASATLSPATSAAPAPASARRCSVGSASRPASAASASAHSPTALAPTSSAASPSLQRARRLSECLVAEPETLPAAAINALRRQRTLDALAAAQVSGRSRSGSGAASPAGGASALARSDAVDRSLAREANGSGDGGALRAGLRGFSPAPGLVVSARASASSHSSPLGRGAGNSRRLSLDWDHAAFAPTPTRGAAEHTRHALGRGRVRELVHPLLALPDVSVFLRQSVPVPRGFAQAHAEGLGHNRLLPAVAGVARTRAGAGPGARLRAFSAAEVLTTLSSEYSMRAAYSPARVTVPLPLFEQMQVRSSSASPGRKGAGISASHARSLSGGGGAGADAELLHSLPLAVATAAVAASPQLLPSWHRALSAGAGVEAGAGAGALRSGFPLSLRSPGSGSSTGAGSGTDEAASLRVRGPAPPPLQQQLLSASVLARQRARPRSIGTDLLRRRSASWLISSPALAAAAPATVGAAADANEGGATTGSSVGNTSPLVTAPTSAASSAAASSDDEAAIAGRNNSGTPRLWRLGANGSVGGGGGRSRGGAVRVCVAKLGALGLTPGPLASAPPPSLLSIAVAAPMPSLLAASAVAQQYPDGSAAVHLHACALGAVARAQAESMSERSEPATSPFLAMTPQARRHLGGLAARERHLRTQSMGSISDSASSRESEHGGAGDRALTPLAFGASSPLRKLTPVGAGMSISAAAPAAALETALLSALSPSASTPAIARGLGLAWPQVLAAAAASSAGAAVVAAAARAWQRFARGGILLAESVAAFAGAVAATDERACGLSECTFPSQRLSPVLHKNTGRASCSRVGGSLR